MKLSFNVEPWRTNTSQFVDFPRKPSESSREDDPQRTQTLFYCSKRIQIGATAPGSAAHDEYRLKEGCYADEGSKSGVHLNEKIRVHPTIDPRVQAIHQQDVQDQAQSPSQNDQPPASIAIHGKAAVKKLSVLLPAELHRRARRHALLHDKTLTTLIIELLSEVLDDADTQPPLR